MNVIYVAFMVLIGGNLVVEHRLMFSVVRETLLIEGLSSREKVEGAAPDSRVKRLEESMAWWAGTGNPKHIGWPSFLNIYKLRFEAFRTPALAGKADSNDPGPFGLLSHDGVPLCGLCDSPGSDAGN